VLPCNFILPGISYPYPENGCNTEALPAGIAEQFPIFLGILFTVLFILKTRRSQQIINNAKGLLMAEIRSTLDMVMERAAKLCDTADSMSEILDCSQDGMRAGAEYLQNKDIDISKKITAISADGQPSFIKGMLDIFSRNLVLPRDEEIKGEDSLAGIQKLGEACGKDENLANLINEIRTIMSRYIDHKKQLRGQLEENFASQMGQMEDNLTQQTGIDMKLEPSQHPQFAKEWQNVTISLNEQYGNALEQYKTAITQQLTQP
jgi:hypothetical protein